MPNHEYTQQDLKITNPDGSGGLYMRVVNKLIIDDEELDGIINFQFPPLVKSDQKKANWKTIDQASFEPVAFYMGSEARAISLQWEYVVTSKNSSGSTKWNIDRITKMLRNIKAYFYVTLSEGAEATTFPLFHLKLFEYAPLDDKYSTWRGTNVSITPSGPLITDNDKSFYMKHTITANLELMTQNNPIISRGQGNDEAKVRSQDLPKGSEIKKWF